MSASHRDTLFPAFAASTRTQRAVSSSMLTVTFVMTTKLVIHEFRVNRIKPKAERDRHFLGGIREPMYRESVTYPQDGARHGATPLESSLLATD
jgi:hypothetical protein